MRTVNALAMPVEVPEDVPVKHVSQAPRLGGGEVRIRHYCCPKIGRSGLQGFRLARLTYRRSTVINSVSSHRSPYLRWMLDGSFKIFPLKRAPFTQPTLVDCWKLEQFSSLFCQDRKN